MFPAVLLFANPNLCWVWPYTSEDELDRDVNGRKFTCCICGRPVLKGEQISFRVDTSLSAGKKFKKKSLMVILIMATFLSE